MNAPMVPGWKVERDPYLSLVAARWGLDAVVEAGFFADDDPDDAPLDDVEWLCTPTDAVRRGLARRQPSGGERGSGRDGEPPVVLLSTGGFFPVHDGHLQMMDRARAGAEVRGWPVIGGYLSPGHDRYLRLKCGGSVMPAGDRIAGVADSIGASGRSAWLAVDPWEATARRVAVNFTDVAARLEAYLRHHVDARIEVAFVCGADNARFALAFAERGRCIVVGRPGHDDAFRRWQQDDRLRDNPRILFLDGDHEGASTPLRPVPARSRARHLVLRTDGNLAVATLGVGAAGWHEFQRRLQAEIAAHVPLRTRLDVIDRGPGDGVPVVGVPVVEVGAADRVLSLDPFRPGDRPGDADLQVSRCFDLGGRHLLGHVARPGSAPLDEQLAQVGEGDWVLRDEDVATGATLAFVRDHLAPRRSIRSVEVDVDLAAVGGGVPGDADLADSRDFLLGADHGGLVVSLPDGRTGRAPYLLPYVDPAVRWGLPAAGSSAFSRAVWRLNAELFAGLARDGAQRCVADLPPAAAATMHGAGFTDDTRLADVCAWHAARLDAYDPPTSVE